MCNNHLNPGWETFVCIVIYNLFKALKHSKQQKLAYECPNSKPMTLKNSYF